MMAAIKSWNLRACGNCTATYIRTTCLLVSFLLLYYWFLINEGEGNILLEGGTFFWHSVFLLHQVTFSFRGKKTKRTERLGKGISLKLSKLSNFEVALTITGSWKWKPTPSFFPSVAVPVVSFYLHIDTVKRCPAWMEQVVLISCC